MKKTMLAVAAAAVGYYFWNRQKTATAAAASAQSGTAKTGVAVPQTEVVDKAPVNPSPLPQAISQAAASGVPLVPGTAMPQTGGLEPSVAAQSYTPAMQQWTDTVGFERTLSSAEQAFYAPIAAQANDRDAYMTKVWAEAGLGPWIK